MSAYGLFGSASSPTFGGKISYYPTPLLTLSAQVDRTFTAPGARPLTLLGATVGYAATAPARTTLVKVRGDYDLADYWKAYAFGGYGKSNVDASLNPFNFAFASSTTQWSAGVGTSYTFWRNIAITLEYQFAKSLPNNPNNTLWWIPTAITQNLATAGLTYRY